MWWYSIYIHIKTVLFDADNIMPKETAIVGDGGGCFLFNSTNYEITSPLKSYTLDAVALVFAKDKNKSPGTYSSILKYFFPPLQYY